LSEKWVNKVVLRRQRAEGRRGKKEEEKRKKSLFINMGCSR